MAVRVRLGEAGSATTDESLAAGRAVSSKRELLSLVVLPESTTPSQLQQASTQRNSSHSLHRTTNRSSWCVSSPSAGAPRDLRSRTLFSSRVRLDCSPGQAPPAGRGRGGKFKVKRGGGRNFSRDTVAVEGEDAFNKWCVMPQVEDDPWLEGGLASSCPAC